MPPSAEQGQPGTPRAGQQLRRGAGPTWPLCDADDSAAGPDAAPLHGSWPRCSSCRQPQRNSRLGAAHCLIPLVRLVAPQPSGLGIRKARRKAARALEEKDVHLGEMAQPHRNHPSRALCSGQTVERGSGWRGQLGPQAPLPHPSLSEILKGSQTCFMGTALGSFPEHPCRIWSIHTAAWKGACLHLPRALNFSAVPSQEPLALDRARVPAANLGCSARPPAVSPREARTARHRERASDQRGLGGKANIWL